MSLSVLSRAALCLLPAERTAIADQPDVAERIRGAALAVHAPRNQVIGCRVRRSVSSGCDISLPV